MARCTLPALFGLQDWFDRNFLDLCEAHDAAYETRIWRDKITSDFILAAGFASRGHWWLGFASLFYTTLLGTPFWMWHGRDKLWKR